MRGFTLIESLVYMTLFAIIMSTAFVATQDLIGSAQRLRSQSLLQTEGDFLSAKIALAPTEIQQAGTSFEYVTAFSTIPLSSAAISVSGFSHTAPTNYLSYVFSLSSFTNEGQKISKDFSILIPIFP